MILDRLKMSYWITKNSPIRSWRFLQGNSRTCCNPNKKVNVIITCSGGKGQGKIMSNLQNGGYELTKEDVYSLIKGVSGILEPLDDRYDLSVSELRILQENADVYDSFRFGFYKGMMYQKGKNQKGKNQIVIEEKESVAPVQPAEKNGMPFKMHIVSSKYGLASAKVCDLPESYRARNNQKDLMQTLFFYMKERDMIVLNEDNMLSHAFGELLCELLPLSDSVKAEELTKLKEVSSEYFGKLITVIGIQEYRRIMGYPTSGLDQVPDKVIDFNELYEDTLDYAPEASERLREALNSMNKAFEVYLDEVQKGAFRQGYTVAAEHKR